jgi:hypothetical protein
VAMRTMRPNDHSITGTIVGGGAAAKPPTIVPTDDIGRRLGAAGLSRPTGVTIGNGRVSGPILVDYTLAVDNRCMMYTRDAK